MALFSLHSKSKYAVLALLELNRAPSGQSLQSRDLAGRCGIPHRYLEQVLSQLAASGILVSTRGAHGGYSLRKDAQSIYLRDILELFQAQVEESETEVLGAWTRELNARLHAALPDTLASLAEQIKVDTAFSYAI